MLYLDTSLLVAAMAREGRTAAVQDWLSEQAAGSLAISDWVITEFSSALSVKLKTGQLTVKQRADALALFTSLAEENFVCLTITQRDFHTAARFADQYQVGLRAGDALHLATAAGHGARLVTLDKGLAKAADSIGVSVLQM